MNSYFPSQLFSTQIDSSSNYDGLYSSNYNNYNDNVIIANNNNALGTCGMNAFPGFEIWSNYGSKGLRGLENDRSKGGLSADPRYLPGADEPSMQQQQQQQRRLMMAKDRGQMTGYDVTDERMQLSSASSLQPSPGGQWSPGSALTDESHSHPSSSRLYTSSSPEDVNNYRGEASPPLPQPPPPCIPYYPWMAVVGEFINNHSLIPPQ